MPKKNESEIYSRLRRYYDDGDWAPILDYAASLDLNNAPTATVELIAAAYASAGDNNDAIPIYGLIVKREPKNVTFLLNLARTLTIANRANEALTPLVEAIKIQPKNPDLLHRLGLAHHLLGNLIDARRAFEKASKLSPSLNTMHDFGKFLVEIEDYESSCVVYEQLDPLSFDDPELCNDYGVALLHANRSEEAISYFKKSLARGPSILLNQQNLSKALLIRGEYLEALNVANALLNHKDSPVQEDDLFMDIALPLQRMGRYEESREVAIIGAKKYLQDEMLLLQRATMSLALEANKDNWRDYQARHAFSKTGKLDAKLCPVWTTEDLNGQSLLVWTEQSYGDQLIFLCSMRVIADVAKEITLVVWPRLETFARHHFAQYPNTHIVTWAQTAEPEKYGLIDRDYDYQLYLGDPWATYWDDRPMGEIFQHLTIPEERVQSFESLTNASTNLRIGISWFSGAYGSRENEDNLDKSRNSLTAEDLGHLVRVRPAGWFNLQYGETTADVLNLPALEGRFFSTPDFEASGDILDYGAQISAMDLVISMDSTAAVFAACLGKPTWVLCPNDPSWFWTINEQMHFCENVSVFIKPWNLPWSDFIILEVAPRLERWLQDQLETNK